MEERLRLSGPLKWATLSGPLPLLRLQVLVADYNEIGQSAAIERYVARSCDLMGSDPVEAAQIDMWSEHVRELKDKYKAAKARRRRQRGALGSATARLLQ